MGELYNGEVDRGEGSGFLIGDSLVVTSSHVIPRVDDYRKLTLTVRFLTATGTEDVAALLADRDMDADVAVLKLGTARVIARPPCPIESFARTESTPQGSDVVVLGYPVGIGFTVTAGVVGNQDQSGRWQTDAAINPGNSGGPVFDLDGHLLGFAVAGMTWFGDDRNGSYVSGVNYFVPVHVLMDSPVAKYLKTPPTCWTVADADAGRTTVGAAAAALLPSAGPPSNPPSNASQWGITLSNRSATIGEYIAPAKALPVAPPTSPVIEMAPPPAMDPGPPPVEVPSLLPQTGSISDEGLLRQLSEQVPISWMYDDHGGIAKRRKTFTKRVTAEPGYVIESCTFRAQSENNSKSATCTIAPDGKSAEFRTILESGPFYDRWRGWWHGDLTLKQKLAQPD